MASYKVLQDIEAEDKLIGPLTLRQFIYAGVCAINLYLTFLVVTKGLAFALVIFMPIAILSGFFAWPWSRDQPTEVWALAKIRFLVKPRKRIWNQSGVKELVSITAPKKVEHILTNGLSQSEVHSRLKALADTIDSRGWAIKNVNVSMYGQPGLLSADPSSDRLISIASLPQPIQTDDTGVVAAADDMLDIQNNRVAQQFESMIAASTKAHRQQVIDKMQHANDTPPQPPTPMIPTAMPTQSTGTPQQQPNNNYWFLNQPGGTSATVPQDTVTFNTQVVAPGASITDLPVAAAAPTPDEEAFIRQLKHEPLMSPNKGHLHVIQPLSVQEAEARAAAARAAAEAARQAAITQSMPAEPQPPVTQAPDPAIVDLARNDDLNVATIAREAQKRKELPPDEVVISLH